MSRSHSTIAPLARTFRALLFTSCLVAPRVFCKADERPEHREEKRTPRVKIAISKETTRILKPLDKEGYVDYLAALNRMVSEGVTTDNNAGVLFVQAFGAPLFKGAQRERFFELLGIKALPEQGDYFKGLRALSNTEQTDFDHSQREPWQARDFPLFAEWLKSNERPLALIVAGTHRARCYIPWVLSGGAGLVAAPLPTEQASSWWARALGLRAMLRLEEGNVAGARDDLYACHRLARHIGSSPCLIGALVCDAIDNVAFEGDAALMEYGKLDARDALAYQLKLRALPPLPVMADKYDRYERLIYLDMMKVMIRDRSYRPDAVAALLQSPDSRMVSDRLSAYWDAVLRVGNETFDEWASAARLPLRDREITFERLQQKTQRDAAEVIGRDLFEKFTEAKGADQMRMIGDKFRSMAMDFAAEPTKANKPPGSVFQTVTPAECGRQIGKVLAFLLLPALNGSCAAEDRARAREALEQVGLALVAYRANHGAYPAQLAALVPKYLAAVPNDPCTHRALRYGFRVDGYLLYSAGPNGVDDGGRADDSQPPGDDIVLQIPARRQSGSSTSKKPVEN